MSLRNGSAALSLQVRKLLTSPLTPQACVTSHINLGLHPSPLRLFPLSKYALDVVHSSVYVVDTLKSCVPLVSQLYP